MRLLESLEFGDREIAFGVAGVQSGLRLEHQNQRLWLSERGSSTPLAPTMKSPRQAPPRHP